MTAISTMILSPLCYGLIGGLLSLISIAVTVWPPGWTVLRYRYGLSVALFHLANLAIGPALGFLVPVTLLRVVLLGTHVLYTVIVVLAVRMGKHLGARGYETQVAVESEDGVCTVEAVRPPLVPLLAARLLLFDAAVVGLGYVPTLIKAAVDW